MVLYIKFAFFAIIIIVSVYKHNRYLLVHVEQFIFPYTCTCMIGLSYLMLGSTVSDLLSSFVSLLNYLINKFLLACTQCSRHCEVFHSFDTRRCLPVQCKELHIPVLRKSNFDYLLFSLAAYELF